MVCVHVIAAEENKATDLLGAHMLLCTHPFSDQRLVSPSAFSGHGASLPHALRSPTLPFFGDLHFLVSSLWPLPICSKPIHGVTVDI